AIRGVAARRHARARRPARRSNTVIAVRRFATRRGRAAQIALKIAGTPVADKRSRAYGFVCGSRNLQSAIPRICNCVKETAVERTATEETGPVAGVHDRQLQVQVLATSMTIHDLSIKRPSVVEYLRTI